MRTGLPLILAATLVAGSGIFASSSNRAAAQGAVIASIGPLTFSPDGTLFAADTAGASIFAFDLGTHAAGAAGAANIDALDQKLAAALGGSASDIRIAALRGVTELDRLDADRAVVIARGTTGMDLCVLPLP